MPDKLRRMKVVIGINDFLVGGAQKLIVDQVKFFNRKEFDLYIITLFEYPAKQTFYSELPGDLKLVRLDFKSFLDLASWWKLFNILRTIKPDAVLSNLFFSNTVFRILKPLLGYKVVITEHNTYDKKTRNQIIVDKLLSYVSFAIIGVSRSVVEFTSQQEGISKDKFRVIHNGIDLDQIKKKKIPLNKDALRAELGLSGYNPVVINVARLSAQKNQALLVRAFNEFLKIKPTAALLILGEGAMRQELEGLIRELNCGKNVFLRGSVKDVDRYYSASDFFISTSRIEGFGIAHVEAMAYGLPVISTKTAGPDEMVIDGENGYFVDSTVGSVVSGLVKMTEGDYHTKGQKAILTAGNYDIKLTVDKYESLIKESLA